MDFCYLREGISMAASSLPGPPESGYSLTCLSGGRQDCADLHSYGPGIRGSYILHYVLAGRGYFETNGQVYPVETGESFLIYPNTVIRYYPDPAQPWEYTWVDFCGGEAQALLRRTGFTAARPVSPALSRETMEPLYRSIRESCGPMPWHRARADGYLLVLLSRYIEEFPPDRQEDDGYSYVLSALQTIAARSHRPLSVEDIAARLGISRTHLYRLFQRHLGIPPHEYLARLRVRNACAMLRDSTLPIKDIARSVGFEDQLYFARVFRRYMGQSPSRYRSCGPADGDPR